MSRRQTFRFAGRLAQFDHSASESEAWDERWVAIDLEAQYRWAAQGALGVYRASFLRYLPRHGLIVEAGCGTGRYVRALAALHYQVIGLDWAVPTLQRARRLWSEGSLVGGDIRCLPLATATASAIISLGVIEHFLEPWDLLRDSVRVLKPGGILYLVVPYANALRRWRDRRHGYRLRDDGLDFYQYLLSDEEIQEGLRQWGLRVVERFATGGYAGLADEWPGVDRWVRRLPQANRLINLLNRWRWLGHLSGHVVHYIAVKDDGTN